jgi:tetratricopeptide (TPR) repeat protein
VNLSGLALVIFSYYMKYYIKSSAIPPPPPPPQVKETVSISKSVSQKIIAKSISIPKKRLTKPPPSFKKNILAKNIYKPKASQTPVISRSVEKKEPPAEGSFLTKESLLNNLLLIAEEERKKGNCQKAIFYYKSYLEERENPSIMNNLGACLIELGEFDSAINIFNRALSLKNDPEIKYNLIIAYFKKGDVERACFELKKLDTNTSLDERMKRLKELCK